MPIQRAKDVPEGERNEMVAESLALVFDPATNLGAPEVIQSLTRTLSAMGDPLHKIWLERTDGKKGTYAIEDAIPLLAHKQDFRFYHAIPKSEVGNSKSKWLTAAIAFNESPNRKGLPESHGKQRFAPHSNLLRDLVLHAGVAPRYGFGFYRQFGLGPEYFVVGHGFGGISEQVDWIRIREWGHEISGDRDKHPNRHRYERGLILDVFPMNVLTDAHLRQKVGDISFHDWTPRATFEMRADPATRTPRPS